MNFAYTMPRKTLSDELKKAIAHLPSREKDKYLFRLIAKDSILTEQLEYQLLEEGSTKEQRRSQLQNEIENEIHGIPKAHRRIRALISAVRGQSALISRHLRVTGDKYGEIELNLTLVLSTLKMVARHYTMGNPRDQIKLYEYIIQRLFKLGNLADKIHEDYRMDFSETLQETGRTIGSNELLMHTCIMRGLDVNELIAGDFPRPAF